MDAREHEEAAAVEDLLDAVKAGQIELVWSAVLTLEFQRLPLQMAGRIALGHAVQSLASRHVDLTPAVLRRATELGLRVPLRELDAEHLACAEVESAVLVTVDRRFRDRVVRSTLAAVSVMDPMEAVIHFGI